jgi:Transposase IS200 like
MNDVLSLSHAVWDCKYHIVWIPKYRRKVLYGELRKHLNGLSRQNGQVPVGEAKAHFEGSLHELPPTWRL